MPLDSVKMNRVTLTFDDAGLEREFVGEYADSVRLQQRYVWLLVGVMVLSQTAIDPPGDVGFYSRVLRCTLLPIPIVMGVAVTFARPALFRRAWAATAGFAAFLLLSSVPVTVAVVARRVPSWRLSDDPWTLAFAETSVVMGIVALHTVGGLRFAHATLANAAFAVLLVIAFASQDLGPRGIAFTVLTTATATMFGAFGSYRTEQFRRQIFLQQRQLTRERAKSESLLKNILPAEIAERLKSDPSHIADGFADVTILFADIVGFTDLSASLAPSYVVLMLNRLFSAFDDLAEKHGLEKIKTIGDAYMVVGGLPEPRDDHAEAVARMALGMRDAVASVSNETGHDLRIRIGANTGPVVAGVIGKKKFAYDLWGDAVNTASRMESHGIAGEIQVTAATYERLKDRFDLESRGTITVKGKGELATWLVRGAKG